MICLSCSPRSLQSSDTVVNYGRCVLLGNPQPRSLMQRSSFVFSQLQALSYIVVIRRSGEVLGDAKFSITSVAAAMYLLVQTASPDLRTGFSLLADGASRRYFIFGACLLMVFGLLITAAMKVIFSSAENDAAVVSNAVTILFVADLVRVSCPVGCLHTSETADEKPMLKRFGAISCRF